MWLLLISLALKTVFPLTSMLKHLRCYVIISCPSPFTQVKLQVRSPLLRLCARGHAALGTALKVIVRGKTAAAEVVAMPFVAQRYYRKPKA